MKPIFVLRALAGLLLLLGGFSGQSRAATLPVTDQVLPSGIRVLVQREPETPLVAIDVFVRTAGAPEDVARPGLANMVARTLLAGTTNQTPDTLSAQIGNLGGNVAASWDRNFTQVRALTLATQFDDTAYLVADVLKNASFDDAQVATARAAMLRQIQAQSDDLYQQTYAQLKAKLYERQDVDAAEIGAPSVIASLRPADLRAFFQRYYTADNIVIAIVGNVDPDQAVRTLSADLADFNRAGRRRAPVTDAAATVTPLPAPVVVKTYRSDLTGGYVMAGFLVPGAGTRDYPTLLVLNALLGGMKTSLLFSNLREKQGLGYDTASAYGEDVGVTDLMAYILSPGDKPAVTTTSIRTAARTTNPQAQAGASFAGVRAALMEQFKAMREQPPSAAMLQRAKRFVAGSYLLRHERLADRAYWLGFSEIALTSLGGYRFDTGFGDKINAVTAQDVQQAAQKYLSAGYVISMVLPGDPKAGEYSR